MWRRSARYTRCQLRSVSQSRKAVHEILQSVVDGPRLPSNALARESHPCSKTTPPCLQTWHPRSEPSARKLSPDRGKKGCSKLALEQTKRVLGAQKRGQAFCMILIAGQLGGPSFGSRFRPQKWDRKMQKKGTSLLFEGFRCGALPGVKFCAVYPNELATALPSG